MTKCPVCSQQFVTRRSLDKHWEKMGHRYKEEEVQFFKTDADVAVLLPVAECVLLILQKDYKEALGSLNQDG